MEQTKEKSPHAIEKELTESEIARGIKRKWIPAKDIIAKLEHIRNTPELWKVAKISGSDQYQGGPMFLMYLDEIIQLLK